MSLKNNKEIEFDLKDYYKRCMDLDREQRRQLAEDYDIPVTQASKAYYEGQDLVMNDFKKLGKGK